MPDLSNLGRTEDTKIRLTNFPFPAEVEEVLFNAGDDAYYGEDEESDEEDELTSKLTYCPYLST